MQFDPTGDRCRHPATAIGGSSIRGPRIAGTTRRLIGIPFYLIIRVNGHMDTRDAAAKIEE